MSTSFILIAHPARECSSVIPSNISISYGVNPWDWYNPVYQFYGDLGDTIMPDAIAKVLESAGLQVTRVNHQVKILGEFPEHINALIEA
jgi:hypothetical protein